MSSYVKLESLCTVITDGSHFSPKSIPYGYPMLSVKDMRFDGFDYSDCNHISLEDFLILKKNGCVPQKNDILIAKDGSYLKEIFVVEDELEQAVLSSIGILRPDLNKINPYFLKYYLSTNYIKRQVSKKYVSGSALPRIILKNFKDIDISHIPLVKQKYIVKVLRNLDLKLSKNNKINAKLESMAKTLYDYWFLQFEFPNEEGKPYKSSGGKMVWNEELKRDIPEGWVVENLMNTSLCADIKAGVDYFEFKNYLPTANINSENITDGDNISFDNRENRANMQPVKFSVWFAKMKNSVKHLTIPMNSDWFTEKYILSTGFQGLKCTEESLSIVHCMVNSNWFENYKDVLSHGATQEGVNNEDLKNIKFPVPTSTTLKAFSKIILPLLERKFMIIRENQELTSLSYFLLPLLMNGQVTFK